MILHGLKVRTVLKLKKKFFLIKRKKKKRKERNLNAVQTRRMPNTGHILSLCTKNTEASTERKTDEVSYQRMTATGYNNHFI